MSGLLPVPNLRGGAWKTVLAILTPLAGAAVLFGGYVWTAARYPDRVEFNAVKDELRQAKDSARDTTRDVGWLRASIDEFKTDVKSQLNRIENNQLPRRQR